jgi:hypothetical protein
MVKIITVAGLIISSFVGCGGAPFTTSEGVIADDAGPPAVTDDAGQLTTDDAGVRAAQDVAASPDAAPDAVHSKQPDAAPTEPHEAGVPDAGQPDVTVPLCGGEATRCFDGTTVQTCESLGGLTSWGNFTACQGACLNGACVACAPGGTADCTSNCNANTGTQTCSAAGVWSPCSTSCP